MSVTSFTRSSFTKPKYNNPTWMDYKDISNVAVDDKTHHFCDAVINVAFVCSCKNDSNVCKYITCLDGKRAITKKYLLWSGSLFRSPFFSKVLHHEITRNYHDKINRSRKEWNIPTLSHVFDITERDCSTYYAFDLLVYLICKLHESQDIVNCINEIYIAIQKNTVEIQRALDLIEYSTIIYMLSDEFVFPLVAQLSLLLSFRFIGTDHVIHNVLPHIHDIISSNTFPSESVCMDGCKILEYVRENRTPSNITDKTFIYLAHNQRRCTFCSFDRYTCNSNNNTTLHHDVVKTKLQYIHSFRQSIIPHISTKLINHKIIISGINMNQNPSIQPMGYILKDRDYILNSKILCSKDNVKKRTEINCFFYVTQNTNRTARMLTVLSSHITFVVYFYSDITGFLKISLDVDLSKFSRCDTINTFLCNKDVLHTKVIISDDDEIEKCVLSKITKCTQNYLESHTDSQTTEINTNNINYSMDCDVKNNSKSNSFLYRCPSPTSSSSSCDEDDVQDDLMVDYTSTINKPDEYIYISFDIVP